MKPTRCTLLLSIFISTSLHVSGNYVPIIRTTCCICVTLIFFTLCGWLSVLQTRQPPMQSENRRNNSQLCLRSSSNLYLTFHENVTSDWEFRENRRNINQLCLRSSSNLYLTFHENLTSDWEFRENRRNISQLCLRSSSNLYLTFHENVTSDWDFAKIGEISVNFAYGRQVTYTLLSMKSNQWLRVSRKSAKYQSTLLTVVK